MVVAVIGCIGVDGIREASTLSDFWRLASSCNFALFFRLRWIVLKKNSFSYIRPTDQLRQQQIDQILLTLKQAYNHYSQQDIPENIFNILFNHTLTVPSNIPLNQNQVKKEKNEIYKLLWEIIESNKKKKKSSDEKWIPNSVQYPAIIIQLLRVRFPSPEADIFLPNCTKYDMKDFIKYTSS